MIASSSQDNYIRLWKLESKVVAKKEEVDTSLIIEGDRATIAQKTDQSESVNDDEEDVVNKTPQEEELKLKSSLFTVHSAQIDGYVQYSMNLESVLYGHEDWIYTVKFHPRVGDKQPLVLLSASIDKTMVVWKYDEENCIWIDEVRVLKLEKKSEYERKVIAKKISATAKYPKSVHILLKIAKLETILSDIIFFKFELSRMILKAKCS